MKRYTKEDWLSMGLQTLASDGASHLTIDAMTYKLSVTKGSFYHHFQNYEDFKFNLLAFWNRQFTERIVQFSENQLDGSQLFQRFVSILCSESPATEIAVRSWAFQDAEVQGFVQNVDQVRIEQAQIWFLRAGFPEAQAASYALLLNGALIGSYSHFPPLSGERLHAYLAVFFRLLGIQL